MVRGGCSGGGGGGGGSDIKLAKSLLFSLFRSPFLSLWFSFFILYPTYSTDNKFT